MEFRILGSLEVWDGPSQIEIGGTKRRALLALLVLHANEVVGKDRLIDELWGEDAPRTAAASLHNHISRLRKALGPNRLGTRAWGYVLRVDLDEVDLYEFKRLIADAEPLPAKERSAKLAEALSVWRGPALADLVFEQAITTEVAELEELRLAVVEARIDAELECGRNAQIVGELETLIAEHPLRERLRAQLILALYRDGRQAEALEVYRETRRLLADELGLEPSPALRELERAVLRQDPSLALAAASLRPVEDFPAMERRWIVYAALSGAALLVAGGFAAFAALHGYGSAHRAAGEQTTVTLATKPTAPPAQVREAHGQAAPSAKQRRASLTKEKRVAAKPRLISDRHSRGAPAKSPSTPASPARSTNPISHVQSRTLHRPSTARKKRRRVPPRMIRTVDTFSGTTMNPQLWTSTTGGTGVGVAQRNGRLELTMQSGATPDPRWNAMAGGYQTACTLTADFDARIDYSLLSWPAANGTVLALNVSWPGVGNVVNLVRKSVASGDEEYAFGAPSGESRERITNDLNGGLRMKRVGSLITSYVRTGRHWTTFASAHHSGAITLQLILWASGSDFAREDVTVAFDNFVLLAPATACA